MISYLHYDFFTKTGDDATAIPVDFEVPIVNSLNDFKDLEHIIKWSTDQLPSSTLVAIDGSQIMPSKEISYPIAVVQAGYFMISFPNTLKESAEISSDTFPKTLLAADSVVTNGEMLTEGDVSLKRQSLEIETARKLLIKLKEMDNPLILLDGTLIYSYMAKLNPKTRKDAIKELVNFLWQAEKSKIPVVGYIDTSYAKDLSNTLQLLTGKKATKKISDPGLFNPLLLNPGDYTIPFICKREPLSEYEIYKTKICFAYLRVNSVRVVRLEFPLWIYEKGLYKKIITRIFAEAALSHGYPRVLTRAHEIAVLTLGEREKFHNLVLKYFNENLKVPVQRMSKANMKHKFY